MASARFAWGIDVGNRALKAVRLSRGGDGNLKIDDFDVIEHEHVLSDSGDNRESLIQSALATFVGRHPIKGGVASIGVAGGFARFIKLPPVEPAKIPEIVKFEAIQQIPFPLDDVEWSYQLFQAPESPDVEVGIFAMRKDQINRYISYFTDVELNVQAVQLNPLAAYNAMAFDDRVKKTTMIMDVGAMTTELVISDGETVWLRTIPIGGNNFTETLTKSFRLPFDKAEELKRTAATNKYAKRIFQEMRPVFADLVAEVQRSMGFYASVHRDSPIKRVLALGGTFRLPGLQKYLQQNLQLPVEKIDRLAAAPPADAKLAATLSENVLSLGTAYGLAVQAMGGARITSSLLPQHIRRAQMWHDKTKWFGLAAACFVAGTGIAIGMASYQNIQYGQGEAQRNKADNLLTQATGLDTKWTNEVAQAGAADRTMINDVRSMLSYRGFWNSALSAIAGAMPEVQPEVLSGDKDTIKKVPRPERTLVQIDRMSSVYSPALDIAVTGANAGGAAAAMAAAAAAAAGGPGAGDSGTPAPAVAAPAATPGSTGNTVPPGSRGFRVMLDITTPHHDGYPFILDTFAKNLQKLDPKWAYADPKSPQKFYVARVVVNAPRQIKDDPIRIQQLQSSYANAMALAAGPAPGTPGGPAASPFPAAFPGRGDAPPSPFGTSPFGRPPGISVPGGGQPGGVNPNDPNAVDPAFMDRVTGEDVRDDWELSVEVDLVLDPAAPAPPPAAAEVPTPAVPPSPATPAPALLAVAPAPQAALPAPAPATATGQ